MANVKTRKTREREAIALYLSEVNFRSRDLGYQNVKEWNWELLARRRVLSHSGQDSVSAGDVTVTVVAAPGEGTRPLPTHSGGLLPWTTPLILKHACGQVHRILLTRPAAGEAGCTGGVTIPCRCPSTGHTHHALCLVFRPTSSSFA